MKPLRRRPFVIALIAILVIAVAAATLNSAVATGGEFGGGAGSGAGTGQGGGSGEASSEGAFSFGLGAATGGSRPIIPIPCYPFLNSLWFFLGVAAVVGVVSYALYRRMGILGPMALLAAGGPPFLLIHAILTACQGASTAQFGLGENASNSSAQIQIGGTSTVTATGGGGGGTPTASWILVAVIGVVLIGAVALFLQSTDDDVVPEEEDEPEPEYDRMSAIGRAAGRAADRIEDDVDPENAVYRAWREMTDHLEVDNPDSSTPAEFATAAVEAGMAREDVDELTALFEEVRYGTAAPTAEREDRAVGALRRIESTYTGEFDAEITGQVTAGDGSEDGDAGGDDGDDGT